MNYLKIYNRLVLYRKNYPPLTGYTEFHHIVPRCIGGDNSIKNLVKLTVREHILAHRLLYSMYRGSKYEHKMALAWALMTRVNGERVSSKTATDARIAAIKAVSGENNPMWGKPGTNLGRIFSKEHREKIARSKRGKPHPTPTYGRKLSDNTKEKIRKANLGKVQSKETIEKRVASFMSRERGKLLDSERKEIHARYATGSYTMKQLAEEYWVSHNAIKQLMKNKRYASLEAVTRVA